MIYRIVGPPGTGKTRSIERNVARAVAKYGPKRVVVCSLTRAAAIEASRRVDLPRNQVGTLHSLIYHEVGAPNIAELHIKAWNEAHPAHQLEGDKASIDEPQAEQFTTDSYASQLLSHVNIRRASMVDKAFWPIDVLQFSDLWEAWKNANDYMDFTDLLTHALEHMDTAPHDPRVLFVDEAQDFSRLEVAILLKWSQGAFDTVIVGDPYQCMFAFRGSDPSAVFPHDEKHTVLSQSYRVPRAVHAQAVAWISAMPGYEPIDYQPARESYPDGATREGICNRVPMLMWSDPASLVRFIDEKIPDDESVMIQTSCAYMLRPLLQELKTAGIPFGNQWRLKAGEWNPLRLGKGESLHERLLAFLRPWSTVWGDHAAFWSPAELASWSAPLLAKNVWIHGSKAKIDALGKREDVTQDDTAQALAAWMLDEARATLPVPGQASVEHAAAWWQARVIPKHTTRADYFRRCLARDAHALRKKPRITVGTIHSLKGSEADNVILFPDLSHKGNEEYTNRRVSASVYRQFYVGMTRAKSALYLGSQSSPFAVRW